MSRENENAQDEINQILETAERQFEQVSKQAEMEKALNKQMGQRFEENIAALKQYLPDIAAQFRHYKPKSMRFFCSPSGHANIIEPASGLALYDDDPLKQCQEQVQRNIDDPKFTALAFAEDDVQSKTFLHVKYMKQIYGAYQEEAKVQEPLKCIPEHLGSMIMFGIGLGYHLPELLEKITIDHLYICEPSEDLFYASLFTCDWTAVLKRIDETDGVLHLRIGVDFKRFTADFIDELKDKGSFHAINAVIYQHYPSDDLTQIIGEFAQQFHMVAIGWGFFDDCVISLAHDHANAVKKVPFLRHSIGLPRKWRSMPAFIVANGPSIDASIEYVKANRDDVIIFSCGTAISALVANDIIPDFHVELERTKFTYELLVEFVDEDKMKQMNLLTLNVMHPAMTDIFKWSGMAFKPGEPSTIIGSEFIDMNRTFNRMSFCNPVVANTAMSFACHMGFTEMYLFGVDNGYVDADHIHSKKSFYYTEDGEEKADISKIMRAGELTVDGNFGGTVTTTAFYDTGRHHMQHLLNMFKKVNCYNCSDGAKIKNAFPVYPDDLLIEKLNFDKLEVVEYIKSEFFTPRQEDTELYQQWLAIDKHDEIIDTMIAYTEKEFTSRGELAKALTHQVRYLYSYANTRYRPLYFVLDGSMIYAHAVFRMIIYGFADESEVLRIMHKVLGYFHDYLRAAKEKYRNTLDEIDEQEFEMMEMFKKDHKKKS